MKPETQQILQDLTHRYPALLACREDIEKAFLLLLSCVQKGNSVYTCGNGGSDADARHIVGEMRKKFRSPRPLSDDAVRKLSAWGENGIYLTEHLESAMPFFCLNENSSLLSAYENDAAPDSALAQALFGVVKEGDVLWAISTSGNSRNCVLSATVAKSFSASVFSLTGEKESALSRLSDVTVRVPERETFKVQELHLPVYHCLCSMLEKEAW